MSAFHIVSLVLVVVLASMAFAQPTEPLQLEDFRWKNRLLLIFPPSEGDPDYRAFMQKVEARRTDVEERDLMILEFPERGKSRLNTVLIGDEAARAVRSRFDIEPDRFTVLLIGKDGGVKMRRSGEVDLEDIFYRIDAMPMRQREMRERRETGHDKSD